MIYRSVTVTSPLCGDAVEILSHSLSLPLLHMDFRFSFQNLTICFRCLSPNLAFACFTLWINSSIKLCISLSSIVLKYTAIKKRQIPQHTSLLVSVQCSLTNQRKALFFSLSQSGTKLNRFLTFTAYVFTALVIRDKFYRCLTGFFHRLYVSKGRSASLMVSGLAPGASGPGSSPGHRVVFLGRTLNSHSAPLHPGV